MRRIDTLADLKSEKIRLRQNQFRLEAELKEDFYLLKEQLAPLHLLSKGAGYALVNRDHGIAYKVIDSVLDLVLKRGLLRKTGMITRLLLPFLVKNITKNFVHDKEDKVKSWIADLLTGSGKKNRDPLYDSTTADTDY